MVYAEIQAIVFIRTDLSEDQLNSSQARTSRHETFLANVVAAAEGERHPPSVGEFMTWRQDQIFKALEKDAFFTPDHPGPVMPVGAPTASSVTNQT